MTDNVIEIRREKENSRGRKSIEFKDVVEEEKRESGEKKQAEEKKQDNGGKEQREAKKEPYMIDDRMDYFLHDMFMEIMSNLETLADYEDTLKDIEEACAMNLSAEGETEEEREKRIRENEEHERQLEKELAEAEKEKERKAIERRIRIMDLLREFMLLTQGSGIDGINALLMSAMFEPLKKTVSQIKKKYPDKTDKDIEFDRDDKLVVKAELRRVRMRLEDDGPVAEQKNPERVMEKQPVRKKQRVLD